MAELSPMMKQYFQIKAENEDSILFFRVGDFYEMFFEDAKLASDELDIVLTGKDCGQEEKAPMCGVPFHSCEAYIARLVAKGHKVAICEQVEDPATAKGIVKRDIVRIITPGTVIEENMLDEGVNNYLAAVCTADGNYGFCFTDASTGECFVTELGLENAEERIIDQICRFKPSEILITDFCLKAHKSLSAFLSEVYEGTVTVRDEKTVSPNATRDIILKHFGIMSTENLGLLENSAMSGALGAVITYLYETGVSGNIAVKNVEIYSESQYMRLDMTAIRNLELTETMRSNSKKGSLLWVIDKTKTAMGKRLLRNWVEKPLLSIPIINLRQNAVDELMSNAILRGELTEVLSGIKDIERTMSRVIYGSVKPRELKSLADTAAHFPLIKNLLESAQCKLLCEIYDNTDCLSEIKELIDSAISNEAKNTVREGGIIKKGYNQELDQIRAIMDGSADLLSEIEAREKERTGIKNLKVKFNKVFGYYIEITNSFLDKVPEDYMRKQTLTNAERFITDELKEIERKMLSAKDRVQSLEYELFDEVRRKTAAEIVRFQKTAAAIAKLDALCSLATVAVNNRYCRPIVNTSGTISIKDGRHPVVEQVSKTPFVANDTFLNMKNNRCAIITGPNMAGKSTYMRQTAIITLLAQIGSFVPATSAEIGLVDAIFTRVGASDDLASGKSTFMVEMSEVADILKYATKNSLLILDEIGRGTSTFDGMSIARAVLEYVSDKKKLGAKALFATHYHELTAMETELEGIKNYNIAVKKRGDDITFLRRIVPGPADDSYGIEVAKLSGIPDCVIERAKEILKTTIEEGIVTYKSVESNNMQMPLQMEGMNEILMELQSVDVNTLTPIEAMQILFDICNKVKNM
ncbi:MAG: DNA mismatch repair protein MutS [Clostridia bacterium]|nr:DNA mismatch repair protein MutS [Clostridia bacterium]